MLTWFKHLHLNSSHHRLIQSCSQVDLQGDVQGLARWCQSLQLHHHIPWLISLLILPRLQCWNKGLTDLSLQGILKLCGISFKTWQLEWVLSIYLVKNECSDQVHKQSCWPLVTWRPNRPLGAAVFPAVTHPVVSADKAAVVLCSSDDHINILGVISLARWSRWWWVLRGILKWWCPVESEQQMEPVLTCVSRNYSACVTEGQNLEMEKMGSDWQRGGQADTRLNIKHGGGNTVLTRVFQLPWLICILSIHYF